METEEVVEKTNGAMELVKQGITVTRIENDTQMAYAAQRPRDEAQIMKACMAELETYPIMAQEAIYSKPVGKDKDTGQMKYAENLSIRTAESIANRWSNSAYQCNIVSEDDESVTLEAVFLDYEHNIRHVLTKKVSKTYKSYNGSVTRIPPDRFVDLTIPAGQSKLLREVILRSLPKGLIKMYEEKARELLRKDIGENLEDRKGRMVDAFMEYEIGAADIEKLRGKSLEEFNKEDVVNLIGTYNMLKAGEITKAKLLSSIEEEEVKEEVPLKAKGGKATDKEDK